MRISLIKQPDKLDTSYGGIPSVPLKQDERAETFVFDFNLFDDIDTDADLDFFEMEYLNPINKMCGTLLDNGDVDYIKAEHCPILAEWLSGKLESSRLTEHERCFFKILLEYAREAALLGTGIVVEL